VFVVLGGIMLATTLVGLLTAWWINSSVQSLRGQRLPGSPAQPFVPAPAPAAGPGRK
jgi:hypothetical protein